MAEQENAVMQGVVSNRPTKGGWQEVTLADAPLEIIDGDRGKSYPKQHEFSDSGYCLFLNAGNVTSDGFNFSSCSFISSIRDQSLRKGKLDRQDVVLTTRGTVGNSAYFDKAIPYEHLRINSGMVILRASQSALHPRFLYLFTRSELFLSQVRALRTGSAQPQLPIRDIERITIPLPPLPEQQAIAHVLGTLDDKIELNRRMNETLEEMARALFKSWFVDFDPVRAKMEGRWRRGESLPGLPADLYDPFPNRLVDSELGEIPEGWEVKALEELCTFRAGSAFRKASQGKLSGRYPFIKVRDMNLAGNSLGILDANNWVDEDDLSQLKAKPFPSDTSVFAKIGEGLKQNRIRILVRPTLIDNNMMGAVPHANVMDPLILFYALSQFDFGEIAGGTAMPYLTASALNSLIVTIPPLEKQIPLAETLRFMYKRQIANEIESNALTAQRDVLLPRLVTGDFRVSVSNQSFLDANE